MLQSLTRQPHVASSNQHQSQSNISLLFVFPLSLKLPHQNDLKTHLPSVRRTRLISVPCRWLVSCRHPAARTPGISQHTPGAVSISQIIIVDALHNTQGQPTKSDGGHYPSSVTLVSGGGRAASYSTAQTLPTWLGICSGIWLGNA